MIRAFKDLFKVNIILSALFYAGIAVSAFMLYRLPSKLMLPYGHESTLAAVYTVIAVTFILGIAAVSQAMR